MNVYNGDLPYYKDNSGILRCGDSAEALRLISDDFFDMTITSPPYDNRRSYNGYSFDFEAIAKELYRVTKQGGIVVWIVGDATINGSETGTSFRQALFFMECGFNLHDTMIYQKKGGGACGSNLSYWQGFEYMFVFSKGKPKTVNRIKDKFNSSYAKNHKSSIMIGRRKENGESKTNPRPVTRNEYGFRNNVWEYVTGCFSGETFDHPAQFPSKLAEDHIISWSNEGDIVLDCFMGSGTTAIVCEKLNRKWYGIEISEEYCQLIKNRIIKLKEQEELF